MANSLCLWSKQFGFSDVNLGHLLRLLDLPQVFESRPCQPVALQPAAGFFGKRVFDEPAGEEFIEGTLQRSSLGTQADRCSDLPRRLIAVGQRYQCLN